MAQDLANTHYMIRLTPKISPTVSFIAKMYIRPGLIFGETRLVFFFLGRLLLVSYHVSLTTFYQNKKENLLKRQTVKT